MESGPLLVASAGAVATEASASGAPANRPAGIIPAHVARENGAAPLEIACRDGGGRGLLDCESDAPLCCLGLWCPCWLFGRNVARAGAGDPDCGRFAWQGALVYAVYVGLLCSAVGGPLLAAAQNLRARYLDLISNCNAEADPSCFVPAAGDKLPTYVQRSCGSSCCLCCPCSCASCRSRCRSRWR